MTETTLPSKPVSRRDFMKLAWAFFGGVAALETAGVFIAYLQPRLTEGDFGSVITAGLVDDFPPNSVTHISNGRFYLVRLGDGGFLAVYHRCTHLGCTVPWDPAAQKFICPCHNSQFDQQGVVELLVIREGGERLRLGASQPGCAAREAFEGPVAACSGIGKGKMGHVWLGGVPS